MFRWTVVAAFVAVFVCGLLYVEISIGFYRNTYVSYADLGSWLEKGCQFLPNAPAGFHWGEGLYLRCPRLNLP